MLAAALAVGPVADPGAPGWLVGAAVAAAVPRWRVLIPLTVVVGLGLLYAAGHLRVGGRDDDEAGALFLIALVTNFAGWMIGLAIGSMTTRLSTRHE